MVAGSLNDKSDPEGSCVEDIVDVGSREGRGSQADYHRGGESGVSSYKHLGSMIMSAYDDYAEVILNLRKVRKQW